MSEPDPNGGFFSLQAASLNQEESEDPLFELPGNSFSMLGLDQILNKINTHAIAYFEADSAVVGIIQQDKIRLQQLSVEGETQTIEEVPLSNPGNPLIEQAYTTGKIVSDDNYLEDFSGESTGYNLTSGLQSGIVIPVTINDRVVALLSIGKRTPYKWDHKDYLYAEQIKALAALAITNAQKYYKLATSNIELEARNKVLETLMDFNRRLRGPIELTPTAERGLMLTMEIVNAEVGVLHLVNETNPKQLSLFLSRSTPVSTEPVAQPEFPQWAKVIKLGFGPIGRAMRAKRSLVIDNLSAVTKTESDAGIKSGMFVPLLVGDNLIGSLSLLSRQNKHFTEQQVLFTETIAGQIATAIQQVSRIELRREQERLSAVLALARTAAHDLNQPLQVLQAELEFITKMGETPSADTYNNMLVAVKDMTSKIREYQKIVRVETTEQIPGIRVIDRSRSLPPAPDKN